MLVVVSPHCVHSWFSIDRRQLQISKSTAEKSLVQAYYFALVQFVKIDVFWWLKKNAYQFFVFLWNTREALCKIQNLRIGFQKFQRGDRVNGILKRGALWERLVSLRGAGFCSLKRISCTSACTSSTIARNWAIWSWIFPDLAKQSSRFCKKCQENKKEF